MITEYKLDNEYYAKYNSSSNKFEYFKNNELMPSKVNKLYKFMSFNNNSIASLLQSYFWLSNPASFNDPFDCNKNLIINYEKIDSNKIEPQNYFEDKGIVSFAEAMDSSLMWAHYTNNYNGFVLEIDSHGFEGDLKGRNKLYLEKHEFRKVIYPEYFPPLPLELGFSKDLLFFIKVKQWEYENEWRIIASVKENMRYYEFDKSIITKIFVGYNLFNNPTNFGILKTIHNVIYPHAEFYFVYPHQKLFGVLECKKIPNFNYEKNTQKS